MWNKTRLRSENDTGSLPLWLGFSLTSDHLKIPSTRPASDPSTLKKWIVVQPLHQLLDNPSML